MKHVEDMDLIALAAGRLAPQRRDAVADHLEACAECRERYEATAEVWQALGAWKVTPPSRDLAPAVEGAARREAAPQAATPAWRRRARAALRLAAVVALSAGVGHLTARVVRSDENGSAVAEADAEAVSQALKLGVLEQPAPAGIADAVLALEAEGEEEAS